MLNYQEQNSFFSLIEVKFIHMQSLWLTQKEDILNIQQL